ncbi:unnamed protein product [Protopolystoma xenopodis]|uniref:Uncharacterized protein n=1 Tax=Protopolystoma xenopodis TaxID=117903 RepID=A0A3S5CHY0_9PLAT|nr:unnamed protein product [Protopolystoma xenopodis]
MLPDNYSNDSWTLVMTSPDEVLAHEGDELEAPREPNFISEVCCQYVIRSLLYSNSFTSRHVTGSIKHSLIMMTVSLD